MFLFVGLLNGLDGFGLKYDQPGGTQFRQDATHLDIFMALFMVCTIEIVVLKIMDLQEQNDIEENDSSSIQRRNSAEDLVLF